MTFQIERTLDSDNSREHGRRIGVAHSQHRSGQEPCSCHGSGHAEVVHRLHLGWPHRKIPGRQGYEGDQQDVAQK